MTTPNPSPQPTAESGQPMKYTKKPVTIEAVLWRGDNVEEIAAFTGPSGLLRDFVLVIKTLEGEHIASVGDYIIKGVKGEFYPCKPDITEKADFEKVRRWSERDVERNEGPDLTFVELSEYNYLWESYKRVTELAGNLAGKLAKANYDLAALLKPQGETPEGGGNMCVCGHEREAHFEFGCGCETERDVTCECKQFRLASLPPSEPVSPQPQPECTARYGLYDCRLPFGHSGNHDDVGVQWPQVSESPLPGRPKAFHGCPRCNKACTCGNWLDCTHVCATAAPQLPVRPQEETAVESEWNLYDHILEYEARRVADPANDADCVPAFRNGHNGIDFEPHPGAGQVPIFALRGRRTEIEAGQWIICWRGQREGHRWVENDAKIRQMILKLSNPTPALIPEEQSQAAPRPHEEQP